MRHVTWISAAGLALTLAACAGTEKKEEAPAVSPEQQASEARQQAAGSASRTLQEFQKQRAEYSTQAEAKLNDLEAKIASLKAAPPADETQRQSHASTVAALEGQLANARSELDQLGSATIEEWADRQQAVEQAILTVQAGYQAAGQRFAH